jgi:hypothetical protein
VNNSKLKLINNETSPLTAGVGPGTVWVSDHLLRCWIEGNREGQQHAP